MSKKTEAKDTPLVVGEAKVGSLRYQVFEEGDGENVYDADSARVGLCCFLQERIYIYRDMSLRRKRRALAHELAHAYLDALFDYRDKYGDESMCGFMEAYAFEIVEHVNRIYPMEAK